jgi:hypothetical protein
MMTKKELTQYKKGAIAMAKEVAKKHGRLFTMLEYSQISRSPYKLDMVFKTLDIKTFNEFKTMCGLPVNRKRKPSVRKNAKSRNRTERTCNMEDCGKIFLAVDNMRSCPSCTNLKGGESYAGLNEYLL